MKMKMEEATRSFFCRSWNRLSKYSGRVMELWSTWVNTRSRLATTAQLAQVPRISPRAIQKALMPAR